MSVKILVGDKGYVDFDNPLYMSVEEREKFIELLKHIFTKKVVKTDYVDEFRKWRIGERKIYPREWDEDDYYILLEGESHEEISKKLGRSEIAVILKDGVWRPQLVRWCEEKGKNLLKGDKRKIIREFLEEQKKIKLKRKLARRRRRNRIKEIERKIERLDNRKKDFERIIKIGLPLYGMGVEDAKKSLKEIEKKKADLLKEKLKLVKT